MANSDDQKKNENREISGVALFGDLGRQRPVEEGDPLAEKPGPSRKIDGQDLFGDAGSPEALAILFSQKAEPVDRFAGLKKLIGKLRAAFTSDINDGPIFPEEPPPQKTTAVKKNSL